MNFYNTYRPQRWSELVGQPSVVEILQTQSQRRKFAHSYLLYGPSGTGKTSTARILAASMNCQNGHRKGEPCGKCLPCQEIQKGSFWDVIEIDGARFRGVDEAKSLAFKAHLAPLNGGRKVYIIDEAHALTTDAQNVLLKLLEEPPPNVCLILCTTKLEGILETVRSRCQLYPFNQLKPEDIKVKLERICKKERIKPDPRHLQFIAESASGNMRVAENILEQVAVLGRGRKGKYEQTD
jgi:DNA polymerase-3 subunit gamma/tau